MVNTQIYVGNRAIFLLKDTNSFALQSEEKPQHLVGSSSCCLSSFFCFRWQFFAMMFDVKTETPRSLSELSLETSNLRD